MSYDEYYAMGQGAKKEVRTPKYKQRVVPDKKKVESKRKCRTQTKESKDA